MPSDKDIIESKYIKSVIPDVLETMLAIPTGPAKSSMPDLPVINVFTLSKSAPINPIVFS